MRYLNVCFLGLALFTLAACNQNDDTTKLGNWIIRADYGGDPRYDAVCFVINDTAYVGTGYTNTLNRQWCADFWAYHADKDYWTQKADMVDPSTNSRMSRLGASAFAANGKGYVVGGSDSSNTLLRDTWAFDPIANSWAKKADYPGSPRVNAVGFGLLDPRDQKEYGFVGTGSNAGSSPGTPSGGSDSYLSDFYKYNTATDTWSQAVSIKDKRSRAVAFVIGDSAYVVTGASTSDPAGSTRMFCYNIVNDIWNEKAQIKNATDDSFDDDYTTIARWGAVGFVINGKGYITCGGSSIQNTWEYDPINDRWTEKTAFDGQPRSGGVGFSVKNVGFVTIGANGSSYLVEMKAFNPSVENDVND